MIDALLKQYSIHGNWVDLIFLTVILIFIISSTGFIESLFELLGFLGSILLSFETYPFFGKILMHNFNVPRGIAHAVGFFLAWFILESVIYILILIVISRFFVGMRHRPLNKILRFIPSSLHACIIYLFFVSLIFSLPVRGTVKASILQSQTGPFFINISQSLEKHVKSVFGGAVSESLNFLTIKPKSDERIELDFRAQAEDLSPDTTSESTMLTLLNKERSDKHLKKLDLDENLQMVARKYARQMLEYGFFSHVSKVDGSTALERAVREGIIFQIIGENLAFAPDVYLAHQGLMNSEGHRANILSTDYSRVGVGVIDGGVYGRMFVQVFTD